MSPLSSFAVVQPLQPWSNWQLVRIHFQSCFSQQRRLLGAVFLLRNKGWLLVRPPPSNQGKAGKKSGKSLVWRLSRKSKRRVNVNLHLWRLLLCSPWWQRLTNLQWPEGANNHILIDFTFMFSCLMKIKSKPSQGPLSLFSSVFLSLPLPPSSSLLLPPCLSLCCFEV